MWYIPPVPEEDVSCEATMMCQGVRTCLGQPPIAACHDDGVEGLRVCSFNQTIS